MLVLCLGHKTGAKHQLFLCCSFKPDTMTLRGENKQPSLSSRKNDWGSVVRKQSSHLEFRNIFPACHRAPERWNKGFEANFSWWSPMIHPFGGETEVSRGCALHISALQHIPWGLGFRHLPQRTQGLPRPVSVWVQCTFKREIWEWPPCLQP